MIKLDAGNVAAPNDRGIAYGAKGDHDRAIKDFDQAVKLDGKNAVALNNRGIAYRNQGKYDRAIADFDEAIKLKPDYAVAMYNRGTPTTTSSITTAPSRASTP